MKHVQHFQIQPMFPLVCLCTLSNLTYFLASGYFWFIPTLSNLTYFLALGYFWFIPTLSNLTYFLALVIFGFSNAFKFNLLLSTELSLSCYILLNSTHAYALGCFYSVPFKFNPCLCPRLFLSLSNHFEVLTYFFALGYLTLLMFSL